MRRLPGIGSPSKHVHLPWQVVMQVDNRTEELSAKLAALQGPSGAARQIAGPPGNGPYFSSQQQGR